MLALDIVMHVRVIWVDFVSFALISIDFFFLKKINLKDFDNISLILNDFHVILMDFDGFW